MTTDAAEVRGSVPVVRLEWFDRRAETIFGRYLVWRDPWSAGGLYEMRGPDGGYSDTLATADRLPTIEAAKAAAQADFEQRILSAVNPDYASALDTARAEIERLRGGEDVLHARLESLTADLWQSKLKADAAQARIAELEGKAGTLITLLDDFMVVSSLTANDRYAEAVDALRATLSPAVKEPK